MQPLPSQLAMLRLAAQHPGGRALVIDAAWRRTGRCDTALLARAAELALAEVEVAALGAVIGADGAARLVAAERAPVDLLDCTEEEYGAWRERGTLALDGTALLRASVVRIGDDHVVRLLAHHAVLDGYAVTRVFRRVVERFEAAVAGTPLGFARQGDLAALAAASAPALPPDPAFWSAATSGLGAPGHPVAFVDRTLEPADRPRQNRVRVAVPGVVGRRTWPIEAVATIAAYTARVLGTPDAHVGIPAALRRTPLERATPVQWMAVLPARLDITAGATPAALADELVRWLGAAAARVRAGERPEQLATAVRAAWRTGRLFGPLVNVLPDVRMAGWSLDVAAWGPVSDCLLSVHPVADGELVVDGVFHPGLYSAVEAADHVDRVAALLGAALADPEAPLPEVRGRPVDAGRVAVPGGWIVPDRLVGALLAAGFTADEVGLDLDAPVTVVLHGVGAERLDAARAVVPPGVRIRRA